MIKIDSRVERGGAGIECGSGEFGGCGEVGGSAENAESKEETSATGQDDMLVRDARGCRMQELQEMLVRCCC